MLWLMTTEQASRVRRDDQMQRLDSNATISIVMEQMIECKKGILYAASVLVKRDSECYWSFRGDIMVWKLS